MWAFDRTKISDLNSPMAII